MKKNICVVTTKSVTIKTFLIDQLMFLSKHEFDVTIICDTDVEFSKKVPECIIYRPVPMKRGLDFFGSLKSILKLYIIFKNGKYDIVQYSTPNAALYASIAAWMAKIPVRLYCQWGLRYVGFSGIKREIFKTIEKFVCLLSTQIEPDSHGNLFFSRKEGLYTEKNSSVIWNGSANGIDLNRFNISNKPKWRKEIRNKYGIEDQEVVFGFIGRLDKDKGINELLVAFNNLNSNHKNIKLMIVGPNDKNEGLEKELYLKSKKNKNVIYTGFILEVEKYLSAMDVFILPSYREGFGSVVVEAEAMGVPVIVTNIPGPTDAMKEGKTGLVVSKGNSFVLAEAMEKLLLNPLMRIQMGEEAIKFSRNNFDQSILWKYIVIDRNNLIEKSQHKKVDL